MRKHIALFTTVAALAVTPALAQTTTQQKPDAQPAPQAQPSQPSGQTTQTPSAMPADKSAQQAMPAEKFINTQASGQWLGSDLIGMNVVGSKNENIGSVSDLLVDGQGNVIAAIIGVGGFLGIGQKDVAISFESLNVTADKDGDPEVRLSFTKEELEGAPEFKTADAAKRDAQRQTSPATKPAAPAPRN